MTRAAGRLRAPVPRPRRARRWRSPPGARRRASCRSPAAGVRIDAAQSVASVTGDGVELTVQPSAWRGSPWDLRDFVTPFLVTLANDAAAPVEYDYVDFRLFDDARFQYTALPPVEVERILRWRAQGEVRLAAPSSPPPVHPSPGRPRALGLVLRLRLGLVAGLALVLPAAYPALGDIYLRALPMGALQPAARLEGFVYFPAPPGRGAAR